MNNDEFDQLFTENQRYKIIKKIGEGGMGQVYRAYDIKLEREVALKFLIGAISDKDLRRLRRETKLMGTMNHPNIVSVYDRVDNIERPFIAMELIKGCSLHEYVQQKSMTIKSIVSLMIKVSKAIEHIHKIGVIHRDLKLANIMIDENGEPKVMDFGLAKMVDSKSQLSNTGAIIGSIHYMSPEQARGNSSKIDHRSDIYSLGVILYELLTKKKLFEGASVSVLFQILNEHPKRPREIKKKIPKDLEFICLKALQKKAKNRYQNITELLRDLEFFQQGKPIRGKNLYKWKITRNACVGLFAICVLVLMRPFLQISQAVELSMSQSEMSLELIRPKEEVSYKEENFLVKFAYKATGNIKKIIFEKMVPQYSCIELSIKENSLLQIKRKFRESIALKGKTLSINVLLGYGENKFLITIVDDNKKSITKSLTLYRELPRKTMISVFRGNIERSGKYESPDINKKPKVRKFEGAGKAPPIVIGNMVFYNDKENLRAVNIIEKRTVWKFPLSHGIESTTNSPCWTNGLIFFGEGKHIRCFDAKTGDVKWSYETKKSKDVLVRSSIVANGLVFCYQGKYFYCLDMYSGELLWYSKHFFSIKTPAVISLKNNAIYFCVGKKKSRIYGLDINTGKKIFESEVFKKVWWSCPALYQDKIYIPAFEGDSYIIDVITGKVKRYKLNLSLQNKGIRIRSSFAVENSAQYLAISEENILKKLNLDKKYESVWLHAFGTTLKESTITSPIITDNNIYIAADKSIYALTKMGKLLWSIETGGLIYSSPVIHNGILYCASTDGYLYVLE